MYLGESRRRPTTPGTKTPPPPPEAPQLDEDVALLQKRLRSAGLSEEKVQEKVADYIVQKALNLSAKAAAPSATGSPDTVNAGGVGPGEPTGSATVISVDPVEFGDSDSKRKQHQTIKAAYSLVLAMLDTSKTPEKSEFERKVKEMFEKDGGAPYFTLPTNPKSKLTKHLVQQWLFSERDGRETKVRFEYGMPPCGSPALEPRDGKPILPTQATKNQEQQRRDICTAGVYELVKKLRAQAAQGKQPNTHEHRLDIDFQKAKHPDDADWLARSPARSL